MIARAGSGWQYLLADLSLILFMITAAVLSQTDDTPKAASRPRQATPLSQQGEPTAFYRAEDGAPPLGRWLNEQSTDARQQLTIVAQYVPGELDAALRQADALARDAGAAGSRARIVVEPGTGGTTATLAYDMPPQLARNLQKAGPE